MKKLGKVVLFCAVLSSFATDYMFSQTPPTLESLRNGVDFFSQKMAQSLPFNSTMGLNWSDAYIGQLLALPPHFGIGLTTGFTTMDFGSLNGLLERFDVSLPDFFSIGGFPIPGYVLDARIGGFVLPFDIGIKFGYLDLNTDFLTGIGITLPGVSMNYMLVGADVRYALLPGKVFPLKVSIGVGFNYLSGGIAVQIGEDLTFSYPDTLNVPHILKLTAPELGFYWETKCLDFKVQASFPVVIITPYLGFGASVAWSRAGFEVDSSLTVDGDPIDNSVIEALQRYGLSGITANGLESYREVVGWSFRAFGGLSVNLTFFKIDLTAMYNFMDNCYGVTLGARFQL